MWGCPRNSLPLPLRRLKPWVTDALSSSPPPLYKTPCLQTAFFCQRILSAKCGPAVTPGEGAFVSPVREEAPLAGRPQALWSPGLIIAQGGRGWLPGRGLSLGGVREAPCEKLNPEHSHQLAAFQSVPVGASLENPSGWGTGGGGLD